MQIKLLTDSHEYEKGWEAQALSVLQSWQWSQIKDPNSPHLRLGFYNEDDLVGVITIQVKTLAKAVVEFGYAPRAKLPEKYFSESLAALKNFLQEQTNLDFVLFDFDYKAKSAKDEQLKQALKLQGETIQPQHTNIIDLGKSEEELWMDLRSSYRRKVKKARRAGLKLEVYEEGEQPFQEFWKIMEYIFSNTKYVMHSREYFQRIWSQLSEAGKVEILLLKQQQQLAGAYMTFKSVSHTYELYGGINQLGRELDAGSFLKWESILHSKNSGKQLYDQWGVAPQGEFGNYDNNHELYHISRFKAGFGGNHYDFVPQYSFVQKPLKLKAFNLLMLGKGIKLKLTKLARVFT